MKKSLKFIPVFSVLFTMLLLLLQVESASAVLRQCRGDPIFVLSDKTVLIIVVEMDTEEADVQEVAYELHIPPGVNVERVVYTAGGLGEKETYEVFQDNLPGYYTTDTYITTRVSDVNVVVTSSLQGGVSGAAVGHEGEHLIVELQSLPRMP